MCSYIIGTIGAPVYRKIEALRIKDFYFFIVYVRTLNIVKLRCLCYFILVYESIRILPNDVELCNVDVSYALTGKVVSSKFKRCSFLIKHKPNRFNCPIISLMSEVT